MFSRDNKAATDVYDPKTIDERLAESAGLKTSELCALEGLSSNLPDATNQLANSSDGRWEHWLTVLDETMHDPAVVAISEHFVYVGRVPVADKD